MLASKWGPRKCLWIYGLVNKLSYFKLLLMSAVNSYGCLYLRFFLDRRSTIACVVLDLDCLYLLALKNFVQEVFRAFNAAILRSSLES